MAETSEAAAFSKVTLLWGKLSMLAAKSEKVADIGSKAITRPVGPTK